MKAVFEEESGSDDELLGILCKISDVLKDLEEIYYCWTNLEANTGPFRVCRVKPEFGPGRPHIVIKKDNNYRVFERAWIFMD